MRAPIVFGALVLLATITMVSDRRALLDEAGRDLSWWEGWVLEVAIPIQKALVAPVDAVRKAWQSYADLIDVRENNTLLRRQLAELEEENLQYREALVASGHLQRIASMRDEFEIPMLPAQIVGLDISPWFRSVLVDRGGDHGVEAGNPVITARGVVGLVTKTSPHAAKTMLLLDRQSIIAGVVQRSRVRGVVRGRGTDQLAFEFVVRGGDVRVGDVILTSALGGVYPKGLRLGEVIEISAAGGSLIQIAILRPSVDFGKLEQVFVMMRRGPTMALLYSSNAPDEEPAMQPSPQKTTASKELLPAASSDVVGDDS